MPRKNYYLILGVATDATQDEIQRAFRRLAKDLHPDYYGQDSKPFLDLQEAYAVLGDPSRRIRYDRERRPAGPRISGGRATAEPLRPPRVRPEPLIPKEQPLIFDDLSLTRSFQTFGPSFEELLDQLWRNYSPARPEMDPLASLTVEIILSPRQALRGGRVRLRVPAQMVCSLCSGRGGIGGFECVRCNGTGHITAEFPIILIYPPGVIDNHVEQLPLDSLGVKNLYLNVIFRIGH